MGAPGVPASMLPERSALNAAMCVTIEGRGESGVGRVEAREQRIHHDLDLLSTLRDGRR